MDNAAMKRTIKIGNWQEEKALESMMNGKVYDPKIKTSTNLTNLRVIKHSAEVDAKDYQSVVRGTYRVPQQHDEYKNSLIAKNKGPRERLREQMMRDTVESEFKMKEDEAEKERNSRRMETTSQASYSKEFTQTLRDRRSGLLTGERRDPYYLVPSPITYYLHTLLSGQDLSFPVTTIGSLNKPWARGDSVSADIHNGILRQFGTFENPGTPPTVKEFRILLQLRKDILMACSATSPPGLYGSTIRLLTQQLLDLNGEPVPRASHDDISSVLSTLLGIELTGLQRDALTVSFTRYRDTRIILVEFIEYLRGSLTGFRSNLVLKAFNSCFPDRYEFISEEGIISSFNKIGAARALSDVSSLSGEDLLNHLLDSLQVYTGTGASGGTGAGGRERGVYELNDFMEYYRDVNCEIIGPECDGVFEHLLTGSWDITTNDC